MVERHGGRLLRGHWITSNRCRFRRAAFDVSVDAVRLESDPREASSQHPVSAAFGPAWGTEVSSSSFSPCSAISRST